MSESIWGQGEWHEFNRIGGDDLVVDGRRLHTPQEGVPADLRLSYDLRDRQNDKLRKLFANRRHGGRSREKRVDE